MSDKTVKKPEKDIRNNIKETELLNRDKEGRIIPEAFPVSESTKKDQRKTSVAYTAFAVILYLLAVLPIIGVTLVLAIKSYQLVPYYSFWPFIATIVVGVFMLIFVVVTLIVTRKSTKSSILGQTAKVVFTYVFLTSFIGVLMTYVFPDIIAMATQNTLYAEDLYYNAESQMEFNAKLDRDFMMYNLLAGNLNEFDEDGNIADHGDFSYQTLSAREEGSGGQLLRYVNEDIETSYQGWLELYSTERDDAANLDNFYNGVMWDMEYDDPTRFELYNFIYENYVLNDFDYALGNNIERRCFALAILDYIYENYDYEGLLREGFANPRVKELFDKQFDSFQQDGYNTLDDSLLLYAQMKGRMTVPVVLRLILNEGWSYSQPAMTEDGTWQYDNEGNFLYTMYDPAYVEAYKENGGTFEYTGGTLIGFDGELNYGFDENGWQIFENGYYKRKMTWLVLDMQGTPMDLTSVDMTTSGPLGDLSSTIVGVLNNMGTLTDAVGDLVTEDLKDVIQYATNGANLRISLYIDDANQLQIKIVPMNVVYGMLGYQYASWVQSNNLLTAVINVMNARDWLLIFGGVGAVILIAVGVLRECGKKTRERTEVSRDRIRRANSTPEAPKAQEEKKADKKVEEKKAEEKKANEQVKRSTNRKIQSVR